MSETAALLTAAAFEAQRAYLRAVGVADAETLAELRAGQDRTAEAVNAWGWRMQAQALPAERIQQEPSDDPDSPPWEHDAREIREAQQ